MGSFARPGLRLHSWQSEVTRARRACSGCIDIIQPASYVSTRAAIAIIRRDVARRLSQRLVAITRERFDDLLARGLGRDRRAAELPHALLRHPRGQVAGAGRAMLHLAGRRQAEPLLRTLVCLLLRHGRPPSKSKPLEISKFGESHIVPVATGGEKGEFRSAGSHFCGRPLRGRLKHADRLGVVLFPAGTTKSGSETPPTLSLSLRQP
jgi:hypothetical protein